MLPTVCSFWHGDLDWLGRLCIASYLDRGHPFELYCYESVGPVPKGCVLRDAESVMPRADMFFYKGNRTPAVFADLFRLKLMQQEAGIWVDCDCFCLQPYEGLGDYIFGIESHVDAVNNAVFRCPPQGKLLDALFTTFEPGSLPAGMPWARALEVRVRRLLGQEVPAHHMQFGSTGPWPLTHHLKRLGLFRLAQPKTVFYPLDYTTAPELLKPEIDIGQWTTPNSLSAHFWHSLLTRRGNGRLPVPAPGSFFATELARLGPAFGFSYPVASA
ncbi:MAG: hypothetical protein ABI697_00950 [Devosia sp.]